MAEPDFQQLDVELFIGEVKRYPEIWNVAAEIYHDRTKKRNAWINICRLFCDEFDKEDDRDKNEICNKLIKKWRNIKDNYMKSLKRKRSGQVADSGRQYIYARQLSFLQQAGAETDTQPSLDEEKEEQEKSEDKDDTPEIGSENIRPPRYEKNSRKRRSDLESSLIEFMKAPLPSPAVPQANADMLFFESLIPSISSFTEDQKLEFRCEVLNLVKRMRLSQQKTSEMNLPPKKSYIGYPQNIYPYQPSANEPSFITPNHSNDFLQTPYHQSSTRLTELRKHPHSAKLPQACSPGLNLQAECPSTSSSACSEIHPDADSLDIYMDGRENK